MKHLTNVLSGFPVERWQEQHFQRDFLCRAWFRCTTCCTVKGGTTFWHRHDAQRQPVVRPCSPLPCKRHNSINVRFSPLSRFSITLETLHKFLAKVEKIIRKLKISECNPLTILKLPCALLELFVVQGYDAISVMDVENSVSQMFIFKCWHAICRCTDWYSRLPQNERDIILWYENPWHHHQVSVKRWHHCVSFLTYLFLNTCQRTRCFFHVFQGMLRSDIIRLFISEHCHHGRGEHLLYVW